MGGVMVTSVPYQLRSSVVARKRAERAVNQVRAGDVRRGRVLRSDVGRSASSGSAGTGNGAGKGAGNGTGNGSGSSSKERTGNPR
jgi:hypothetical protein